ncbi:MAG: fumarylacetoacetate hydrolase family protein [Burkholderiaceae bacterium]
MKGKVVHMGQRGVGMAVDDAQAGGGVAEVVAQLVAARRAGGHLGHAAAVAELSAEAAYRVQAGVADHFGWFADGPPRHWKSGGASRDALLTHAPLPPTGVLHSPADLARWPFALRGIEAEIALRLGAAVDVEMAQRLGAPGLADLVDAMAVSIEVVDSRWREGMGAPANAKLADLQSHGALVLGDWVPFRAVDWAQQRCRARVGAQAEVVCTGTHAMGDPAWLLPHWLRHACGRFGALPAGAVLTTGTWVGILWAQAGDAVHVAFDGIGQAHVQL